jgi:hypothetical protein
VDVTEANAGDSYYQVAELCIPTKEAHCEFVGGDTPEERVEAFARHIAAVTSAI